MKLKHLCLLISLLTAVFLTSCRSSKQRQEIQKTEIASEVLKESKVSYKDTTLFAPEAKTGFKVPMSQLGFKDSLNAFKKPIYYTQKNGQATAKLKIVHDTLYVEATCDSVALRAQIKSELEKELSNNSTNTSLETEETTKTGYTLFDVLLYTFLGFIAGFGICFVLKTFRII
jgi:hypothetical protein